MISFRAMQLARLWLTTSALFGCSVLSGAKAGSGSAAAGGTLPTGGGNAGGNAVVGAACQTKSPGPSPMRRLTRFEYNNTVRDLLGDTTHPADAFPPEEVGNGFGNDANALSVSRLLAEQYANIAKNVADRLISDPTRYTTALGCAPAAEGDACAQAFVERFGASAFRRPLITAEKDHLLGLYGQVRALPLDFKTGIAAVVQAVLQSPQFLYRVEFGMPLASSTGVLRLDHFEMASRLSYLLWGTLPDAVLLSAARAQQLGTPEQIRAQAERMLVDPRARDTVRYFNEMLFGLAGIERISKNPAQFPQFTSEIPALLKQETSHFLDYVIWEGAGDLKTIFTAKFSFMNATLAGYYGLADRPNAPKSEAFERVDLDPSRAAGLLTQAGLMAALTPGTQTNPVLRGLFVRKHLFCSPPPPPPPALMVKEPIADATLTTRERFKAHSQDPSCYACHQLLDPVGFAFEHYDAVGRWRDTDNGKPIDSRGDLIQTDVDGSVNDAVDLAAKLAESRQVQTCLVGQWLTYSYGRGETPEDACTRASLEQAFAQSGGRVKDLLVALTQTDAFLYRQPVMP